MSGTLGPQLMVDNVNCITGMQQNQKAESVMMQLETEGFLFIRKVKVNGNYWLKNILVMFFTPGE